MVVADMVRLVGMVWSMWATAVCVNCFGSLSRVTHTHTHTDVMCNAKILYGSAYEQIWEREQMNAHESLLFKKIEYQEGEKHMIHSHRSRDGYDIMRATVTSNG